MQRTKFEKGGESGATGEGRKIGRQYPEGVSLHKRRKEGECKMVGKQK